MISVLQRVSEASVTIDQAVKSKIGGWLLVSSYVLINIIFVGLAVRG